MANKRFEVDQGLKIGGNFVIDESTGDITTTGNIHIAGAGGLTFPENMKLDISQGGTGAGTQQGAINALAGAQTSGYYLRGNGTNVVMAALNPSDLSSAVSIIKGGTGQTSQQAAINALVGTQASGYYLRSDGTNVTMSALSVTDLSGTNITLAKNAATAAAANGAGLTVDGANATITYTSSTDTWNFNKNLVAGKFTGNVTGNIAASNTGVINVTGNLIPTTDVAYDLGSPDNRFKTLYLAGNTIDLGGALITTTEVSMLLTAKSGATFEITGNVNEKVSGSFSNLTVDSGAVSTSTTTGALVITGGAGVSGNLYADNVYDNGNRTITSITSSGAGSITITTSSGPTANISLSTVGTAGTYGSNLAIPIITTDAYGRVTTVTLANNIVTASSTDTLTNKTLSEPVVNSPSVKGEKAVVSSLGTLSTGTTTVDLTTAQIFTATIASSATVTFAFSNAPGANLGQMVMLRLTNGAAGTINWPANTKFSNGIAPILTSDGVDMLGIFYDPVSTTYMVFLIGKDIK